MWLPGGGPPLRRTPLGSQRPGGTIRERFSEPLRATALRTGSLALAIGLGVGLYLRRPAAVPVATLVALWFTLGGHLAEVVFRNGVAHRLGPGANAYLLTRLVYWFAAGCALYAGALATLAALTGLRAVSWPWWIGGVGFLVAEALIHVLLQLRGAASVYNGRG